MARTWTISFLLVFSLLLLPVGALAQLSFTTNSGAITITGYDTNDGFDVIIPAATNGYPVTAIGSGALEYCSLTSVVIPNSVTSIGSDAFMACSSLTNITVAANNSSYCSVDGVLFDVSQANLIQFPSGLSGTYSIPNTVTNIGSGAFGYCGSLTSVVIPNSVTRIGSSAFSVCANLTSATIPNSVTSIGDFAFAFSGLTNVLIGSGVTNIDGNAFMNCDFLSNVTLGCPNVLAGWFYSSPVANVILLNTVTNIGNFAFFLNNRLTSVKIPNSVTTIGDYAFSGCYRLTNVVIGNGVTNIGSYAFYNCPNLLGIDFQGNSPTLTNDLSVFTNSNNGIVYYLPGTTGWGSTFDGLPAVQWNPQAQTGDGSFGVQANQFGFNIIGSSNLIVVVEASTDLSSWSPVSVNTLNTFVGTNGTFYFSDPHWTNYPCRFYRIRSP